MIYKYDPSTDILVLILGKGKLDFGEQKGNIITHYDKKGKPLEIEILDASRTTMKMMDTIVRSKRGKAITSKAIN